MRGFHEKRGWWTPYFRFRVLFSFITSVSALSAIVAESFVLTMSESASIRLYTSNVDSSCLKRYM